MQFTLPLDELFHGKVAVRVLRILALFPTKEFTGRELARDAGVPPSNAIAELNRFQEQGMVQRRTVGRAQLWKLVATNVLAQEVRRMFEFERALGQDLRRDLAKEIKRIPGVERAVLFGSTARGSSRPSSDIDVLVIVEDARSKQRVLAGVQDLRRQLGDRYGNRLQLVVYSRNEWRDGKAPQLIRSIEQEGQLVWERSP